MLNCRPSSYVTLAACRPCGRRAICPHCWGRQALECWRAADAFLFPGRAEASAAALAAGVRGRSRPRARYAVVERVIALHLSADSDARRPFAALLAKRTGRVDGKTHPARRRDHARLRAAGAVGGLEHVLASRRGGRPDPDGTRVRIRQVLFVPRDALDGFLADRRAPRYAPSQAKEDEARRALGCRVTLAATRDPSPKQLVAIAARAWRYPRFLLRGDPEAVLAAPEDRRGHRLSTRFGKFFGIKGA